MGIALDQAEHVFHAFTQADARLARSHEGIGLGVAYVTDCGLPSMTSSCQAGIMFGDNYDIPAYRWYDKSQGKLYVSAADAAELNARYAHGQGLTRHGSSVMNMLNGNAEKQQLPTHVSVAQAIGGDTGANNNL